MRIIRNLILLGILLICQQYIVAQSYYLGKQKQSFAYETLYANHAQKTINNNEIINTQPAQKKLTDQNEQKVIESHKQIVQLINNLAGQSTFKSIVVDVYINIYQSSKKAQEKFLQLQQIQHIVLTYLENKARIYPNLEKELKNASSIEEQINIFLSYSQEQ